MSRSFHKLLRSTVLVAALGLISAPSEAQFAKLDGLGEDLAKKLKPLKLHMIAVADLTGPDGAPSSQGDYFSSFLSVAIQRHGKDKVPVAEHGAFDALLLREHITPHSLSPAEFARVISTKARLDALVTGTIEKNSDSYVVKLTALRVPDGKILDSRQMSIRRTEFTDSLSEPFPQKTDYPVYKPRDAGVKWPTCVFCPQPSYTDSARRQKIQGVCLFDVLVSAEGRAVQIHPNRMLGYELDQAAFEAIKRWKFKPAERNGDPVAAVVEIEVSFHLK